MKKNNFKANETAYIGDIDHDIHAGKKAKVRMIAVSWGYYSKERLSKENPDHLIDNFKELKEII